MPQVDHFTQLWLQAVKPSHERTDFVERRKLDCACAAKLIL